MYLNVGLMSTLKGISKRREIGSNRRVSPRSRLEVVSLRPRRGLVAVAPPHPPREHKVPQRNETRDPDQQRPCCTSHHGSLIRSVNDLIWSCRTFSGVADSNCSLAGSNCGDASSGMGERTDCGCTGALSRRTLCTSSPSKKPSRKTREVVESRRRLTRRRSRS